MKAKTTSAKSVCLLVAVLFSPLALSLPSQDDAHNACLSITASRNLDPVIEGIYGRQLYETAINDCMTVIKDADGDPKKAEASAKKLKSIFSKSMWKIVGSPYVSQQEKSMAINMADWHSVVMNSSQRIASDYKSLYWEAKKINQ